MNLSIAACLANIEECSKWAHKMRQIIENPNEPANMKYKAVVIEEAHLELIQRYITHIYKLKQKSVAEFKI